MSQPDGFSLSRMVRLATQRAHWLALGLGGAAVTICATTVLTMPLGAGLELSMDRGDSSGERTQSARLLAGVGGQTYGRQPGDSLSDTMLTDAPLLDVSPAALDDDSGSNCLTITAEDGKVFSFRIKGLRAHEPQETMSGGGPKLELAIEGCAQNGEPVVNAVIEPEADPVSKDLAAASERSL